MSKLIIGENDLLTWCKNNGEWGQRLIDEWVGQYEDGTPVEMNAIYEKDGNSRNGRKVLWKCRDCGEEWPVIVYNRTVKNYGCPVKGCMNKRRSRSLIKAKIDKTLADEYPELMNEWDFEKNIEFNPYEIASKSGQKVWWTCKNGHSWHATIINRTVNNSGCPYCKNVGTSYGEQFIFRSLKSVFPDALNRYKLDGVEYDIYIKSKGLYIEYSGENWHRDKADRDEYKKNKIIERNESFISILEYSTTKGDRENTYDYIVKSRNKRQELEGVIIDILNRLGVECNINFDDIDKEATKHSKYIKDSNLCITHPNLISEWDFEKNIGIHPEQFTSGSNQQVWWRCGKEHSWKVSINARTNSNTGCPYCSNRRVLAGFNDLETKNPELASEWNYNKNDGKSPRDFTVSSRKEVWWQCKTCGYEWQATICNRYQLGNGCPSCGKKHSLYTKGIKPLSVANPELAKEIHNELNHELDANKVYSHNDISVYWRCPKCNYGDNGNWHTNLHSRARDKTGCPNCGYNWYKAQTGQPQKLKRPKNTISKFDDDL